MPTAATDQVPLRERLRELFTKAKLPSSPALAAQLLELAGNPNATVDAFARLIQMDPVLSARLLKMANSAHFAQRNAVTTIQRAVTVLGMNRVRTVALGFQLVGHLDRLGNCPFDMKRFWQESLLRGCLAREVAAHVVPDYEEEAFLIGLLQDCGILLLVQLFGAEYAAMYQGSKLSPTAFFEAEKEKFSATHMLASEIMSKEWQLPEAIGIPVGRHHRSTRLGPGAAPMAHLCAVSYLVGSMRLAGQQVMDSAEPSLHEYATAELHLNEEQLRDCLARAGEAYKQTAGVLKDSLPEDVDITDLLSEANSHLMSAAGNAEMQVQQAEQEKQQFRAEQVNLRNALGKYRERAARDPLTGSLNRGALLEAARNGIRNAGERGESVTVLFLDIDNFKQLNDTYGHPAGDDVLKAVAITLSDIVVNAGSVGRYGGEEFVLVVTGLANTEARQFAYRVVESVRMIRIPHLKLPEPVTCSLGAVWSPTAEGVVAEDLLAKSDELMYKAKRSGKDRCYFQSLEAGSSPHTIASGAAEAAADALASIAKPLPSMVVACPQSVPDDFRRVAQRLNQETPQHFLQMRKQQRRELLAPCRLSHFNGSIIGIKTEEAFVRNISTGGVGILCTKPLFRGEPMEVEILSQTGAPLYVAGLVAFCKHVEGTIHEVGVQLFAHGKEPILSKDPISAVQNLDWVAEALRDLQNRPTQVERPERVGA